MIRFSLRPAALFLGLISLFPMAADALELPKWNEIGSGRLILGQYVSATSGRFGQSEQISAVGVLNANLSSQEGWGLRSSLLGIGFLESIEYREHTKLVGRIRDLYAYYAPAGWEFRLGQMMTPWGKADAINPTDYLSARDYRFYISDGELQRLGTTAAYTSFTPNEGNSPLQITAVYQTRFSRTRLLIPKDQVPSGIALEEPRDPEYFEGNEEWALKAAYLGAAQDASISFFRGRNHFPQYVVRGGGVRQEFTKETAVGADYSRTLENLILRAEGAYFMNDGNPRGEGGTGLTQPNHLDLVAGVERPIGERFRAIVQLLWRYHPAFAEPGDTVHPNLPFQQLLRQLGEANALIQNYQKRSRLGGTIFVTYLNEELGLTADLSLIGNFAGGDFLLRPRVGYELATNMKATLGGNFYGGPRDQPLGALRSYNLLFAELGYVF